MTAGIWDISRADYFADRYHISQSMLKDFIEDPALYQGRYVLAPDAKGSIATKESESLLLGTMVHAQLLEPNSFDELYAIPPERPEGIDGRKKEGKVQLAAFREVEANFLREHAHKTMITVDQFNKCMDTVNGIWRNQDAMDLVQAADERELAVRRLHEESGLWLKSLLDLLLIEDRTIGDLKTAKNPYEYAFRYDAKRYGYDLQMAFYIDMVEAVFGWEVKDFLHIVAGTEPPYRTFVYRIKRESIEAAKRAYPIALADLASCKLTNRWQHPDAVGVRDISLPNFRDQFGPYAGELAYG